MCIRDRYRALFDGDGSLWTTAHDGVRRYDSTDPREHMTFQGNAIRWFELGLSLIHI